ncbi:MAG: hypothetical protein WC654_01440 [Patescibacteria group bacterium]
MSLHEEPSVEQEITVKPARFRFDQPDDVVDTAGKIWMIPNQENQKRREAAAQKDAQEMIEARIKTGADMDEYKQLILDQLKETIQLSHGLVEEKQGTLVKENRLQTKQLEDQLKVMATFDAREKVLAHLASGNTVASLLKHGEELKTLLENNMEEMRDEDVEIFSARKVLPHLAYMRVLREIEKNPDAVGTIREQQRSLLDARLKSTGGIGGSQEVLMSGDALLKRTGAIGGSHEVITKIGEPTKESVEEKSQMLLEKKWAILAQELTDTKKELASLGFLQRLFGEKGKFLKTRLTRINTDQQRVYKQILPARQKKLGTEFEAMARAMRKE